MAEKCAGTSINAATNDLNRISCRGIRYLQTEYNFIAPNSSES